MTPELAIVAAFVVPALGLAATWGTLGQRVRALEAVAAKVEGLQTKVAEIDVRTTASAASQGVRIGEAKAAVDRLAGMYEGFERAMAIASRRTKAHGVPISGGGGEGS